MRRFRLLGPLFSGSIFSLFLAPFFQAILAHNGPKNSSDIGQQTVKVQVIFCFFCVEVLELFTCLLGVFLGLLGLSWAALDPKTIRNTIVF